MRNEELFRGAQEREEAFLECMAYYKRSNWTLNEIFEWLTATYVEHIEPCPYCGNEHFRWNKTCRDSGMEYLYCKCGYTSMAGNSRKSIILAHNQIARRAKGGKGGYVEQILASAAGERKEDVE